MTIEGNDQPNDDAIKKLEKLLPEILKTTTEVGDGIEKLKIEVRSVSTDLADTWRHASERFKKVLDKK